MSSQGSSTPAALPQRISRWLPALLLLGLLALVALAVRAQYSQGPSGQVGHSASGALASAAQGLILVVAAIVELALVLMLILAPWRRLRTLGDPGPVRPRLSRRALLRLASLPAVLLLVQALFFAWLTLNRRKTPAHLGAGAGRLGHGHSNSQPLVGSVTLGQSLVLAVVLGMVLLLVVLVVRWRSRRPQDMTSPAEQLPTELASDIDRSLEELAAGADPRLAVISAYERMERTLAGVGLAARNVETPLEYLERALARLPTSRTALARLTDLFETARFSTHAVGSDMRSEAESVLRSLRAELAA
ncbi:MAG: DUF4129 domain-containing protein [Candidatus Dormibacteria bacterium]